MTAYVTWAVIHQQRFMGRYISGAERGKWQDQKIEPPGKHCIGILGLGTLGTACASALRAVGYRVVGWSRREKPGLPAGIEAFHGPSQLSPFLARCRTLICLLPLTTETRGFLNSQLFRKLPKGAHLINVGRGAHLEDDDLLQALDDGALGAATLDTFVQEPLPLEHPFWRHPKITVTPHVAARASAAAIARQTRDNLATLLRGEYPATIVERPIVY